MWQLASPTVSGLRDRERKRETRRGRGRQGERERRNAGENIQEETRVFV